MAVQIPEALVSALLQGEKFLIFTHLRPDGDAIGSSFGMRSFLLDQGKKADALSAGTFIDVIEERSEYSLVRANGHEGWVENRYVKFLNKQ